MGRNKQFKAVDENELETERRGNVKMGEQFGKKRDEISISMAELQHTWTGSGPN